MSRVARRSVPIAELKVALQCGGSDGYSGISVNPALGAAVDLLVRHGGTAILSETTECYGAEHMLTRRAATREVGEKSLGSVAKGGTTNLVDVYGYAETVTRCGLVFMDAPSFDPVGATPQVAGGANLMCFTTGRGSAFGCKPTPSIKLADNTPLYEQMPDDMDLNCGTILDGMETVDEARERIFRTMLDVASGTRSKSELLGYGDK